MNKKHWILLLLLFVITAVVARVYIFGEFPYTHDGENHLARFANYKIAIRELQIPPRIAPVLHNHYGYPVFNYNYPLANILSVPFSFLKISYETTFAVLVWAFLFIGGIGAWFWTRYFTTATRASIFSVIVWLTNPFITLTLWYRGNIGEIAAYSLLPWMFLIIHRTKDAYTKRTFLLSFILGTAFLLSHNITVAFSIPFLALYAVLLIKKDAKKYQRLLVLALSCVGATLWFWLPALAEMSDIVVGNTGNQKAFSDHFVTLQQLLTAPLTFGYSLPGSIDSLGLKIGFLPLLLALGAVTILWYMRNKKKTNNIVQLSNFLLVSFVLTVILQLSISEPVWHAVPFLRFMQFPWRWSLFLFSLLVPLSALTFAHSTSLLKKVFFVILCIILFEVLNMSPADTFHKSNADYEFFTQSSSTQNENMARGFTYANIGDWKPSADVLDSSNSAQIITTKWSGREHIYTVVAPDPTVIVEPTMRFSGWETKLNGSTIQYEEIEELQGRIGFYVPAGTTTVETSFTQNTPARLVGNSVSVVTLLLVTLYLIIGKKNEK